MNKEETIIFAEPFESLSLDLTPFLKEKDYGIVFVKTLKETLLTIQNHRADLLVLDADLLKEDCGFISVIKNIKKDLPIIICSGKNTPELETKIRKQRIFYYHIKSFGIEDLEMAISNAVNGLSH